MVQEIAVRNKINYTVKIYLYFRFISLSHATYKTVEPDHENTRNTDR